jgi:hypothetical protein
MLAADAISSLLFKRTAVIRRSDPEKLFQVGRQRLLDEAIRIDKASRRNLAAVRNISLDNIRPMIL